MAARTMFPYVAGTSALKVDDRRDGFSYVPGGRSADIAESDDFFADDMRIAFEASGIAETVESLKHLNAFKSSRSLSWTACIGLGAVTFASSLFLMLLS